MSNVLSVKSLCKEYPSFQLKNVSFEVEAGSIMGFIGRNGAGKTTTLMSLMNLIHPSSGEILFFGKSLKEQEEEIKRRIGYATGGVHFYPKKRIKDIVKNTKPFYQSWDDHLYRRYLDLFALDEHKKLNELSEVMKVKFNLTMALSHHAEFLILDEPTSGLDPVSRDELLEVFLDIAAEGVSILFSTHITSDLEKCADSITYIKNGEILASQKADDFEAAYRMVSVPDCMSDVQRNAILGVSRNRKGDTGLISVADADLFSEVTAPSMEQIMIHLEKEARA